MDTVQITGGIASGSIDLAGGADKLTLANATNTVTVSNTETVIGGNGTDTITLRASGDRELAIEGTNLTAIVGLLLCSEVERAEEEQRPKDATALRTLHTRVLRQGVSP